MFHLPEHPSMSNIPVARYLSFLFSLLLIGPVAADAGDDFSSNLFSDLAPLLSLFGERVTMQFMSQSMGWADNIILAMAPLGIITVIVSAIRVGGPAWLKAIVGRARENLAVAEAEIMSSTSQEVCELWNGQEVVRCMGSAPVAEFICLTPEGTVTGLENGLELRTIDLDKAKDDKYLEPTELNIRQDFCRWRAPKKPLQSSEEKGQASTSCSASEIIIIRNKSAAAPNISLNSHDQFLRGELRAAAVLGTILQLSVLVYSGFATYYPTLRFEKNGRPVADYAFPCTAAGILVLVAGMLDMFSAFMWAAAETLSDPIKGGADIRPEDSSNDSAWQSFTLRNDYLSKMAHEIEGTGLGSLDQVYLSIIPPLSAEQKLPQADAIVELAKKHARQHEQLKNWKQAGDTYLWLFKRAKTFPEYSVITARSTAVLMEYLRTVTISIELRQRQQYEERDVQGLKDLKSKLEEEMKTVGRGILSHLMRIYEEQGRGWNCIPVKEARCGWVENTSFPSTFNFTKLHHLSQNGRWWELKEMLEKAGNVNPKDIHDWTPLHYAVAKGSPDVIQQLLKRRVNTNAQDHVGRTPLHVAAVNGHEAVARLLAVAAGADKEIKDHDGRTPLHLAAASGSKDVARLLAVQAGADREAKDGLGRTPLHVAAASGIEDLTRLLVEAGADKEAKDRLGRTPLHWAAASGSETVAWLLVEADADKEAKDNDSRTPLHVAAAAGHEAVVRLLAVVAVADKEARDSDGQTPLHVAATGGRVAAVRLLAVVSGADREAKDSLGQTPLHWAAAGGREAVTKVLVEAGADKEARDVMGRTPLHWAAGPGPLNDASSGSDHSGHSDVIRLLVEAGADKEAKDDDGETPLHRAAASGHSGVVRLLVEAGADKEARDGLGRTPLHWAAGSGRSGHPDVVRLLVEAGADKEAKDDNGETPLQRADALGHENVARLLITKVI
ncbi:hypothetical protein MY11210_000198 [Beauveria gryllotalpidicola]